jgi:hypothetical protein
VTTVTKETIAACVARGLRIAEAAKEMGISQWVLQRQLKKLGIKWGRASTKGCGKGHPPDDRVQVGERERCRLCYEAECKRPRLNLAGKRNLPMTPKENAEDAVRTMQILNYDAWLEHQPPWVRHPEMIDPRDVRRSGT